MLLLGVRVIDGSYRKLLGPSIRHNAHQLPALTGVDLPFTMQFITKKLSLISFVHKLELIPKVLSVSDGLVAIGVNRNMC
jgi:hypothetical protein